MSTKARSAFGNFILFFNRLAPRIPFARLPNHSSKENAIAPFERNETLAIQTLDFPESW
jgi:hypothetical protein